MQIKVYVKHREVLRTPKFDTLKFDTNSDIGLECPTEHRAEKG